MSKNISFSGFGLSLMANPLFLLGVAAVIIVLLFLFGFFIRSIMGIALFVIGLLLLTNDNVRKKQIWLPIIMIIAGTIFVLNPGDYLSMLNFTA